MGKTIKLKTETDIKNIAASGAILKKTIERLKHNAQIGVKLSFLNNLAYELITSEGASPSFLNYKPEGSKGAFPASICTSLNSTIVHGVPDDYALQDGDLLKIDVGVNLNGYFSDSAITVYIGDSASCPRDIARLLEGTKKALNAGIYAAKYGARLGDIGSAIESVANYYNLGIAEGLTGHGVGFLVHEDPLVWNYGDPNTGMLLKDGMVLAIEPMFTLGGGEIIALKDGSYVTKDRSLSAQFEHTVAITKKNTFILTG